MPFIQHNGKRVLFVHIPKTGGTSIETWMREIAPLRLFSSGVPHASRCTLQHYRAQDIKALLGGNFFDYSLTVVRNPYDRIASAYRMRVQMAQGNILRAPPAFPVWLEEALDRQKREKFHLDNHLRPQWEFLGKGVKVFRFEDGLFAPLAAMAARLDVEPPAEIPHELSSGKQEIEWEPADRIRVQDHYARDFETFDYAR